MSSEEGENRTGVSHRPYDEAFKRAAVARWAGGVPARRVAEGLGITTESLCTWRRQLGGSDTKTGTAPGGKLPVLAPSAQELQAEVRRLRVQLQSVTNQRDILKKSRRNFRRSKRECFAMIEALEETCPVSDLCAAFDVSRAGF